MYYWICAALIAVLSYVILKAYQIRHYFEKYGIPQSPDIPFLGMLGMSILTGHHVNYIIKDVYNINKEAKYVGVHPFLKSAILVRDLDLIKSVLVKNFDNFADRTVFSSEESDPIFAKSLSLLNGQRWREVRNLLSPAFTSSKMRTMFTLMSHCAKNFADQFVKKYRDEENIDMKDAFTRYTSDVIATCAFGIEVDSLKDPNNEFYLHGRRSTDFSGLKVMLTFFVNIVCPSLGRKLGLRFISKKETDYFVKLVEGTIKAREEQGIRRPDMLQLLMESEEKGKHLDSMDLVAQAFIFFAAGFDTVSGQACSIAHELAVNPDVQQKLQVEIDEVMKNCNGQPTYEAVNSMQYLDAVFYETMRVHPIGFLSRICTNEFELPPTLPGAKPYVLKPGMEILVSPVGVHSDPDYYDNPEKFDPDRYLDKKISSDVLNLGFGLGPRMCIGNRFAVLETKILLLHLLSKCNLMPSKKTCIPWVYAKRNFNPLPEGGFWLRIKQKKQITG
ncbi:cytochrome P450 9e2-like [Nasonia vitripennis]|uniref:Cytochrome P450 n=1 Tax=Nasonia vitripennis TaxID=7425 RepID=A0A7M7GBQ8_NASVI|nr:cytochrome P450 9e2-like [Nasonia vitripennis]